MATTDPGNMALVGDNWQVAAKGDYPFGRFLVLMARGPGDGDD